MFKSAWNRGETNSAPLGSETMPIYGYRIDKKTGKKILVQTGEENLYEKIQASLESSKIENIVKRFTAGDINALNIREGQFIDISEIPTNMIELQNMILSTRAEFDKLPIEIKQKFDMSAEKYISSYGSEEWIKSMGLKIEEPIKEETKKNEKKTEESEVKKDE